MGYAAIEPDTGKPGANQVIYEYTDGADRYVLTFTREKDTDIAYPPGINPLDATLGRHRDKAVDNLITIFERIWSTSWGPRTDNVLEFALKPLADATQRMVQADLQNRPDLHCPCVEVVPLPRTTS